MRIWMCAPVSPHAGYRFGKPHCRFVAGSDGVWSEHAYGRFSATGS